MFKSHVIISQSDFLGLTPVHHEMNFQKILKRKEHNFKMSPIVQNEYQKLNITYW